MKDLSQLNQHPVNRHSLELLNQAKVRPDPRRQYHQQLMRWGLESGELSVSPKYLQALVGTLDSLERMPDQEAALQYVVETEDGVMESLQSEFPGIREPEEAAALLWEELHTTLGARLEAYHTA